MFDYQWDNFLEQQALEFKLTTTETSVFLTRFAHQNWRKKIEDIWQLADVASFESFVKHSTNIYKVFKSRSDGCVELLERQGAGSFPVLRDWLRAKFQETEYSEKTSESDRSIQLSLEAECYQTILQPGALIRIKAPSKMGKSRLLNKILNYAGDREYRTVHINLLQIESIKFNSLERFLRWFCIYVSDALKLDLNLDRYWNEDRGSMLSCTRYLEIILSNSEQPLVLGLDEVDRLLNYPDLSQDFFYLLRSWHEEANNDELWERLRLVVVYSTEDFGSLDINQSPFNVGLPIELQPFTRQQIEELAVNYQLDLSDLEIEDLIKILGGQPYLIDSTLSYLANNPQANSNQILHQAATDTSIYSSYLRQHLINLKSNSQLSEVYLEVLKSDRPIQIDTLIAYQLYRMGLIKWSSEGNTIKPSCQLYQLYFLPRLSS
ncbi:MAG: AAA-like domain-containing protein [Pleurocapsa sp. MO_226.B13]|nr:AAA-like domain-containing protein [Pleurocapsa sp. MO_226.B13]